MERHEVLAMMTALKLAGMRAAYDESSPTGSSVVQQIIGTLLQPRSPTQARSIKYQMAASRRPRSSDFDPQTTSP